MMMRFRLHMLAGLALAAAMAAAACGDAPSGEQAAAHAGEPIAGEPGGAAAGSAGTAAGVMEAGGTRLDADARLENGQVRIEGTTDLPEGSVLGYTVRHVDQAVLPIDVNTEHSGEIAVSGGYFSVSVSVRDWPPGDIEVWIGSRPMPGRQRLEFATTVR
jgi:hypothetical protein